jgi:hypothetical protein
MRQTRRAGRTPSTSTTDPGRSSFGGTAAPPGDPGALLVQRWDELLRLVPPDMGLTAALGQGGQGPAADPVTWLSAAANVPRAELDQVRQLRNRLAGNRPVPEEAIASGLESLDRALAVLGRTRLPE